MDRAKSSDGAVFDLLLQRAEVTVVEAARALGMSNSTTANVIKRLVAAGRAAEVRTLKEGRGRPQAIYGLHLPQPVLVCQFDGTQVSGTIMDERMEVRASEVVNLERIESLDQAVELTRGLVSDLIDDKDIDRGALPGLALSINTVRLNDQILTSTVLPWADSSIEQAFTAGLAMPVKLVLKPQTIAEYRLTPAPAPHSLMRLHVGDGLSAHQVIFGRLHPSRTGLAGELGHVTVDRRGPRCGCGRRGCLEALCSGLAICRRLLTELEGPVATVLDRQLLAESSPRAALEHVYQTWLGGDTFTQDMMDEVLDHLAWGLGLTINLVDPERIVAAGYVLRDKPEWIEQIEQRAKRWVLHVNQRQPRLEPPQANPAEVMRVIAGSFFYPATTLGPAANQTGETSGPPPPPLAEAPV